MADEVIGEDPEPLTDSHPASMQFEIDVSSLAAEVDSAAIVTHHPGGRYSRMSPDSACVRSIGPVDQPGSRPERRIDLHISSPGQV